MKLVVFNAFFLVLGNGTSHLDNKISRARENLKIYLFVNTGDFNDEVLKYSSVNCGYLYNY